MKKSVSILGSTGTIGINTLKLIANDRDKFTVKALTANSNIELLAQQAITFNAEIVVVADDSKYTELKSLLAGTETKIASGKQAISEVGQLNCDILISGIVGAAALPPTLSAIRQGTTIGLANKECLVCAGDLMIAEAKKHQAKLVPIDSEHNSLFQCFDAANPKTIETLTLTASGGPFHNLAIEEFQNITVKQAVAHPNWDMGAKISVDSATMMNKGLEIIEAYHLFPVEKNQINVVIHPESIIHAMVEYIDGSTLAGLSNPDMCVPISYALGYPNRIKNNTKRLNLAEIGKLTFQAPDIKKFPALQLAITALNTGGNAPCILNAANEIAVNAFLNKKISFTNISNVVENTLSEISNKKLESLQDVFATDILARQTADLIINTTR